MADKDAHLFTPDIFITEPAYLADTQAGRIHESEHGFLFNVGHGGDEMPCFVLGRDIGKVFIKLTQRQLCIILGLMQDIKGKETQL